MVNHKNTQTASTGSLQYTLFSALALTVGTASVLAMGVFAKRLFVKRSCEAFYQAAEIPFHIPGLKTGFVPQDLFYLKSEGCWLFSGYMANKRPSPLFVLHPDGSTTQLVIRLQDGSLYHGHGAAITAHGPFAFLTVKDGYVVLEREALITAKDGDILESIAHIPVELEPAFMSVQQDVLYIGEFYHPHFYPTPQSHWFPTVDGSINHALMYAYDADAEHGLYGFTRQPTRVYSIPDDIQGMTITSNNCFVLSRSWGFGNADMLSFDKTAVEQPTQPATVAKPFSGRPDHIIVAGNEIPLYSMDEASLLKTLTVPPMIEGIEAVEGQVYLANESASNLYLLGKAYGGKNVYALPESLFRPE